MTYLPARIEKDVSARLGKDMRGLGLSLFLLNRRVVRLGPVDPLFRALAGRLKFTVRRHKFNTDSLSLKGIKR
jgi:hypothetical protein